ncbi:hypothetical protein D3C80_1742270 [compost metagenome]
MRAAELGVVAFGTGVGDDTGAHTVCAQHFPAKAFGNELADHPGAPDQWFTIGLKHLPRQVGTACVDHQDEIARLAYRRLEFDGQHQLEQGVAEKRFLVVKGAALPPQRAVDQFFHQPRLALLHQRLDAGLVAHVRNAKTSGHLCVVGIA